MASVMNVKESKGFCDEVYTKLADMKEEIIKLKERSAAKSPGKDVEGGMFGRHLSELADQIDWKLQILSHSCPVDWKGAADYEETAQVNTTEKSGDIDFSPGYVGG
ncbi:MAG: hypothetical protein ACM3MD_09190 [Betaproteobacteria bacterium]